MRDQYHEELDGITTSLVTMSGLVERAVRNATTALLDADVVLAEKVISGDDEIDTLNREVEERAYLLLARQQPVARDLRILITSLRMTADLERAGDYASHVAELARRRHPASAIPEQLHPTMRQMADITERIVGKAGVALATADVRAAEEIEKDDDLVDDLHRQLFAALLGAGWAGKVESAVDVTLCGRYYERLADHAVSVARRVVYLATGERFEPREPASLTE